MSLLVSAESLAVSARKYVPAALNTTWVTGDAGLMKVTVPGPAATLQLLVSVPPAGSPSSVTAPWRMVEAELMV
jgi:hypothetical protein